MNPLDASLNEKLAQMASKVYRDVVVPLDQSKEDDPVQYERRQLNIDGTWKDLNHGRSNANGGFHFLDYAKSNFRNPLELIQATSPNHRAGGVGSTTVGQTQQLANLAQLDQYATKKRAGAGRKNQDNRNKSRNKRAHHSQTYAVDEKFSLKVQKKPIQGLKHIKVEQTSGPDGIKLYSIKVQQKNPRFLRNERIKDSIEVKDGTMRQGTLNATMRKEALNETRRWQDGFGEEP